MEGDSQPVTERSNDLSRNIDMQSPVDIVSTLEACDEEIFNGWQNFPGLFDDRITKKLSQIKKVAIEILKDSSRSIIIFSGCGTSGRLGFITARSFNDHLRSRGVPECYHNIMAGGDKALFTSQEAEEDDPYLGERLLIKAAEGKSRVLFFGITCGLSAPFVAGQLSYCLKHLDRFTPVLLGFNPVYLARDTPVHKWDKTFLQVAEGLEIADSNGQGFILNPIVGPEPITGSSRMKGGTATKIMLESILVPAHTTCFLHDSLNLENYLVQYKEVWKSVYQQKEDISCLLQLAGTSLQQGGHVYYIGNSGLGIMGLIDASECPPTYGATFDDVRGFVEGGYQTLGNLEGDLSSLGNDFHISVQDFSDDIVPSLTGKDLVVFICKEKASQLPNDIKAAPCQKACIVVKVGEGGDQEEGGAAFSAYVAVSLAWLQSRCQIADAHLRERVGDLYSQLAVKWTLNAVSTGAHILKGKVYKNIMIDVKASNVKLFHRAVGIIKHFSSLGWERCREYLLRSVYNTDDISEAIKSAPVEHHISIAATKSQVVPRALLAAMLKCSIHQAEQDLVRKPVVRQALVDVFARIGTSE